MPPLFNHRYLFS